MSDDNPTPMLDAHAHIAPDVTGSQVAALRGSLVLAVTRSLSEARQVSQRRDPYLIWGVGIHPGKPDALAEYDADTFRRAIRHFALVGEVGLDRRGNASEQRDVFASILDIASDQPVLISIHSTGRTGEVLSLLRANPHPGAILHWFNGTPEQIEEATALGCHFSVNAAMDPAVIAAVPSHRLLTETDFPSSRRKTQASKPGDVAAIESLIADLHGLDARGAVAANFARLLEATGAASRLAELH